MIEFSGPAERHKTVAVKVGNVTVGGGAPVVVQSMTNTDTADVEGTAKQVAALALTGSELVRITVDRDQAAAAVPHIKDRLLQMNVDVLTIRPVPRRSTNIASIPAMSASRKRRTGNSAPSSRPQFATTRRCASAPIGARSTRSCSRT
jgi:4-hydroxy-3-methylbut-2-en-1-yl diphosphate synthase IspG/GcpE